MQHGAALESGKGSGDRRSGDARQFLHHGELILRQFCAVIDGFQNGFGKLVGRCRGCDHAGRIVAGLFQILFIDIDRHRRMSVAEVIPFSEQIADGLFRCFIIAESAVKFLLEFREHTGGNGVFPLLLQIRHDPADKGGIVSAEVIEQPFQIGGNENIHRRTDRCMECPVPVIDARADKVGVSKPVGDPITLFAASDHPCVADLPLYDGVGQITDGPCLHRLPSGALLMLWASGVKNGNYGEILSISRNGSLFGPWEHLPTPLFDTDGGHGMLFFDKEGALRFVLHQPNGRESEHPVIFYVKEEKEGLTLCNPIGGIL